jgi:hypothetical protein
MGTDPERNTGLHMCREADAEAAKWPYGVASVRSETGAGNPPRKDRNAKKSPVRDWGAPGPPRGNAADSHTPGNKGCPPRVWPAGSRGQRSSRQSSLPRSPPFNSGIQLSDVRARTPRNEQVPANLPHSAFSPCAGNCRRSTCRSTSHRADADPAAASEQKPAASLEGTAPLAPHIHAAH